MVQCAHVTQSCALQTDLTDTLLVVLARLVLHVWLFVPFNSFLMAHNMLTSFCESVISRCLAETLNRRHLLTAKSRSSCLQKLGACLFSYFLIEVYVGDIAVTMSKIMIMTQKVITCTLGFQVTAT